MADGDPRLRRSGRLRGNANAETSSFLDLDADASDDDVPLARLSLAEVREEEIEIAKDQDFINDGNDSVSDPDDEEAVDLPGSAPESPPLSNRARRKKTSNASMKKFFGNDSDTDTDEYSDEPQQNEQDAGAAGESDDAGAAGESDEPPTKKKAVGRPPKVKRREAMALWKRVGESQAGFPVEFEAVAFGFYFSQNGGDLDVDNFKRMCDWMHHETYMFSAGYERGLEEENLHGQVQGELLN